MMIRYVVCLVIAGWLGAASAHAQLQVPRQAFRMDNLDQAKEQAAQSNRPITFLFTDSQSSCGLCIRASKDAMDSLINRTTLVFVDQRTGDYGKLPAKVRRAMGSEAAGSYIPKTVIMDPTLDEVIDVIPYIDGVAARDVRWVEANRKARDRMREREAKVAADQAVEAAAEAKERLAQFAGVRTWTTQRGQSLDAKFVALRGDEVQFQDAAGNPYRIHIALLRMDDQKIARDLAAAPP